MKYVLMCAVAALAIGTTGSIALADGCYMCSGGGYVAYTGDDTFDKRAAAKAQYGCDVSGTTSSCSGAKGTVSSITADNNELFACAGDGHEEEEEEKGGEEE